MSDTDAPVTQVKPEQRSDDTAAAITSNEINEHAEPEEAAEKPESTVNTDAAADEPEQEVKPEATVKTATTTSQPTVKTEAHSDIKLESVENPSTLPIIAQIPNPLFGRAGSAHTKEEDYDDEIQVLTTPPPKSSSGRASKRASNRVLSDDPRNVRARARKAAKASDSAVITECKTRLPKGSGVVIDCTIMAKDGCAVVSIAWRDSLRKYTNVETD
jgi:hypothetical protein